MRQEHLNRWKTCEVCGKSKTLMIEPLSSRTKKLQAMSRQKLKAAVGLLTDHTTPRVHMLKLGLTQRQDCRLCWDEKEGSVHSACHPPFGTGTQKIHNLGSYVLDLQRSRKHEAEWPGSQHQVWPDTLTPL